MDNLTELASDTPETKKRKPSFKLGQTFKELPEGFYHSSGPAECGTRRVYAESAREGLHKVVLEMTGRWQPGPRWVSTSDWVVVVDREGNEPEPSKEYIEWLKREAEEERLAEEEKRGWEE